MKFYTKSHTHFCGIDLDARCLYVCILEASGEAFACPVEPFISAIMSNGYCFSSTLDMLYSTTSGATPLTAGNNL